jgi:hypothetical protein
VLGVADTEVPSPETWPSTGRLGDGERSFRYAPLSSGLDILTSVGNFGDRVMRHLPCLPPPWRNGG